MLPTAPDMMTATDWLRAHSLIWPYYVNNESCVYGVCVSSDVAYIQSQLLVAAIMYTKLADIEN